MELNSALIPLVNVRKRLESVRKKFQTWRGQESKSRKIPEELWDAAVGVVGDEFSVNRVSRILSLDFNKLKHRVLKGVPPLEKFVEITPPFRNQKTFMEIPVAEINSSSGNQLRLFSGEVETIIKAFLKS